MVQALHGSFALDIMALTMISNKKNLTSYYLPSITPVTAICKSTQEYIDKAIQLLDGNLALKKRILTEQQSILKNMTSEEKFWERLLFAIKHMKARIKKLFYKIIFKFFNI